MEIERQETPQIPKRGDVIEDADGDIIMVTDVHDVPHVDVDLLVKGTDLREGASPVIAKHPLRVLRAKLVILGTLLLGLLGGCTLAEDNGFMSTCDVGLSEVECSDVIWPSTPITVAIQGDRGHAELQRAIDRWEHRRPLHSQDLFEVAPSMVNVDVLIDTDACCADGVLGDVRFFPGERMSADMRVFDTTSSAQLECVLFHELGHVLGLAHDDFGPMRVDACALTCDPGDVGCTDDEVGLVDVRVTDADHRRLNRAY